MVITASDDDGRDGGASSPELTAPAKTEKSPGYGQDDVQYDTGIWAWLQVLGAFFLWFNSW